MKIPKSLPNGKLVSFNGQLYQLNPEPMLGLKLMKVRDPSLNGDHDFVGNKDISKVDFEKLIPPLNIEIQKLEEWFTNAFAEQKIDSSIRTEVLQIISNTVKPLPINMIHGVKIDYHHMVTKSISPHHFFIGR